MPDIMLTLYVGVTPTEGHEEAFQINITMPEMPGGGDPVVGQTYQFHPSNANEPLEFTIDSCEEPDADGTIKATGYRWITYASAWHYWVEVLDRRYGRFGFASVHIDMVNPDERERHLAAYSS